MEKIIFTLHIGYFDIEKTAESGQCFRWKKIADRKYLIPAAQTCAVVCQSKSNTLTIEAEAGSESFWRIYFNAYKDYDWIVQRSKHATLKNGEPDLFLMEAIKEAEGVRIVTQDLWETLVSFIISQNNNIPRIKKLIEAICCRYGTERNLDSYTFHTFPTPEQLAGQDLSGLGLGYRDKYLERLAQNVADGLVDLRELEEMETEEARVYLKSIYGVGNKVADCVLLFGLHKVEAFPVDTWIRQVIGTYYAGKFPIEHYGDEAGIVQQFIFYYMQKKKGES